MDAKRDKNLLVISPFLTNDPEKSFWMLILKYLKELGWSASVVTIRQGPYGGESVTLWSGIEIIALSKQLNVIDHTAEILYRTRSRLTKNARLKVGEKEHSPLTPAMLSAAANGLVPVTYMINPSIPDKYRKHSSHMLDVINRLHKERDFKAVISISTPFTAHTTAYRFAHRAQVPWIAAVKDYYSFPTGLADLAPSSKGFLVNWLKLRYEKHVLSGSNLLMPNCLDIADYLQKLVPDIPYRIVTNCYDDEDFDTPSPALGDSDGRFTMVFAGTMYHYDHSMFFEAIQELASERLIDPASFTVKFIGAERDILQAELDRHDCKPLVQVIPFLPYETALAEIKKATCLIYRQKPGHFPRRTSEFIATRRPILAFPECDGTWSQTALQNYGAAVIASSKHEIKSAILDWFKEFQETKKLSLPVNEEVVQFFSASQVACEVDVALQEITSQPAV